METDEERQKEINVLTDWAKSGGSKDRLNYRSNAYEV